MMSRNFEFSCQVFVPGVSYDGEISERFLLQRASQADHHSDGGLSDGDLEERDLKVKTTFISQSKER